MVVGEMSLFLVSSCLVAFFHHLFFPGMVEERRLIIDAVNQNGISQNGNRARNTQTVGKGVSPRPTIPPSVYARYVQILGTHYPFGKPLYNSAG